MTLSVLSVVAALTAVVMWPRAAFGADDGTDDPIRSPDELWFAWQDLGHQSVTMPVVVIRLAYEMAHSPDEDAVAEILRDNFVAFDNRFQRQAFFQAIRQSPKLAANVGEIDARLVVGLLSADPWTRFHAAWATEALAPVGDDAITALKALAASGPVPAERPGTGDPDASARWRAAQSIAEIAKSGGQ